MNLKAGQLVVFAWILINLQQVFAKDDYDLGCCEGYKHRIDTGDVLPVRKKLRGTPVEEGILIR